jgi:uncharacterized membrane protein YjjB (DUF3815 family)
MAAVTSAWRRTWIAARVSSISLVTSVDGEALSPAGGLVGVCAWLGRLPSVTLRSPIMIVAAVIVLMPSSSAY